MSVWLKIKFYSLKKYLYEVKRSLILKCRDKSLDAFCCTYLTHIFPLLVEWTFRPERVYRKSRARSRPWSLSPLLFTTEFTLYAFKHGDWKSVASPPSSSFRRQETDCSRSLTWNTQREVATCDESEAMRALGQTIRTWTRGTDEFALVRETHQYWNRGPACSPGKWLRSQHEINSKWTSLFLMPGCSTSELVGVHLQTAWTNST